ncbi:MAG: LysR family transcriptional regulator [Myxococcota bacterium]|nr:LysR family transcriptional regulator [Myxococcota bacterium]
MNETAPSLQLVAIFVAVAKEMSFSKAAKALGVGKATVSRSVARLEAELGVELLHRTTHAVALSTAGSELYERAAPHVAALAQAVRQLPERAEEPSGLLRLTATHDFGTVVLPELLAQFGRRHPDIRFDVHLTNEAVDLVAEGFDLAIRAVSGPLKDSTLTLRKLCDAEVAFYAAPQYLARRGKPRELGEAGFDWVMPRRFLGWEWPADLASRFCGDDVFLLRELLRWGAGVGVLPRFVADSYVRDGLLEQVAVSGLPELRGGFVLLYPSSGQVPRKVTALRDFLVERLGAGPLR